MYNLYVDVCEASTGHTGDTGQVTDTGPRQGMLKIKGRLKADIYTVALQHARRGIPGILIYYDNKAF